VRLWKALSVLAKLLNPSLTDVTDKCRLYLITQSPFCPVFMYEHFAYLSVGRDL